MGEAEKAWGRGSVLCGQDRCQARKLCLGENSWGFRGTEARSVPTAYICCNWDRKRTATRVLGPVSRKMVELKPRVNSQSESESLKRGAFFWALNLRYSYENPTEMIANPLFRKRRRHGILFTVTVVIQRSKISVSVHCLSRQKETW